MANGRAANGSSKPGEVKKKKNGMEVIRAAEETVIPKDLN